MTIEYDFVKSHENKTKHGLSFEEAKDLWLDPFGVVGPADSKTEDRFIFGGKIADRLWSAIFTFRGPNIRIISVRAARKEEKEVYENQ